MRWRNCDTHNDDSISLPHPYPYPLSLVRNGVLPSAYSACETDMRSVCTCVHYSHIQVSVSGVEKYTKLDSGVYIYDVEEGSGASPRENDQVKREREREREGNEHELTHSRDAVQAHTQRRMDRDRKAYEKVCMYVCMYVWIYRSPFITLHITRMEGRLTRAIIETNL